MSGFLKENWIWIVAPLVLILIGVVYLIVTFTSYTVDIESAVKRIIAETGIGVLLVEQHLHFVRQADRYYAMQRGGIVASGPTSDLSQAVVDQFLSV